MAELDVQPKSKTPWWVWLLIALIILALIFFLRGCGDSKNTTSGTADSTSGIQAATTPNWDAVDFNAPEISYEEIADKGIVVRGNNNYTIYGLGEDILFATGKTGIQSGAEKQLEQISASLKKRYKNAEIGVYGNTDSTGTTSQNKKLGEERAEQVKAWIVKNAGVSGDKISVKSKGESDPVVSNSSAEGRKINRRVEIVVMAQQ